MSLAFCPDGKTLASGSYDRTVKLWDLATGEERLTLKGHTGCVQSAVFAGDGKTLATGDAEGMVKLWRAATDQEVRAQSSARDPREDTARTHADRGRQLREDYRCQDAEKALRQAVDLYGELAAEFPDEPRYPREEAHVLLDLIPVLASPGRLPEVERLYRRAVAVYEKLPDLDKDPPYWEELAGLHNRLGILLRNAGRLEEAERELDRAQALWRGHAHPGIESAKKAVEADRGNAHRWHPLGFAYYRAGDWANALRTMEEAARLSLGGSAWQWFYLALAHWQLDHKEEAYRWYYQSVDWVEASRARVLLPVQGEAAALLGLPDPGELAEQAWVHTEEGARHEERGQTDQAKAAYDKAIASYGKLARSFPAVPAYRFSLAQLLTKTGRHQEAEKASREGKELVRDGIRRDLFTSGQLNGMAWRLANDPKAASPDPAWAVELAKAAVERAPDQGLIVNTLGTAYYRAGNWRAAIDTLKEADELSQGQHFSLDAFVIAMAHWQLGDKDAAGKWHTAAVRWMEKNAATDEELRRFRAEAAALLGVPDAVSPAAPPDEGDLDTLILAAYPEAAWVHLGRGQVYEGQGESENARAEYRRALDLSARALDQKPGSWGAWARRGSAHAALAQWDKASGDFDKAVALGAGPAVRYLLALTRVAANDRAGYRQACAGMLERFGTNDADDADLALWGCVLAPEAVADSAALLLWAREVAAGEPKSFVRLTALGAALYRAGRPEEAVQRLNEANASYQPADERRIARAYTWCFLALAHHRLGHAEEARQWLDRMVRHTEHGREKEGSGAVAPWNRRLTLQLLRREAEELLKVQND
jgi:tetratricopeptide (TPR) repeat protein